METRTYFYRTAIEWGKRRRGVLRSEGLPDLEVSSPPEFKGEAGFWTPEHLFVAAAESCLMATFVAVAEKSRLVVVNYESSATGKLEWADGGLRFTEIVIRPVVELASPEAREAAERVMDKAAKSCLISNSMALEVRVEPKFLVTTALAA